MHLIPRSRFDPRLLGSRRSRGAAGPPWHRSAHLAGWSMGSGVILDFAVAHPDRTRSLRCERAAWVEVFRFLDETGSAF